MLKFVVRDSVYVSGFGWLCGLFLALQMLMAPCVAVDYYVDAHQGSDAQDGQTPQTAWQTVRRVNQTQLLPGDRVFFRAGCTWRESLQCQSGEEGKPILFTRYGDGAAPRFLASVDLCHERFWTREGDSLWCTMEDRVAKEEPAPEFLSGRWSYHCDGKGKATFTTQKTETGEVFTLRCSQIGERESNIQLNNAAFPLRANETYRVRFRARASIPFEVKNVSLIQSRHPWSGLGSVSMPEKLEMKEEWQTFEILVKTSAMADVSDGRLSFFVGASLPTGCEWSVEILDTARLEVESLGLTADVGNIILVEKGEKEKKAGWKRWSVETLENQGDFYYDPQSSRVWMRSEKNPAEVYDMMEAALKRHIFVMGGHHDFILDGLAAAYTGAHGAAGGSVSRATIRNCRFLWIGGSHLYTRDHGPVRYGNGVEFWCSASDILVENNYFAHIYDVAMTNQGPDPSVVRNVVYRGNKTYRCEQGYEIWFSNRETRIQGLVFEQNECVESGFGWSHAQRPDKRGTHLLAYGFQAGEVDITYRNNVFNSAANAMIWFFNPRIREFKIDQNTYIQPVEAPSSVPLFYWSNEAREGVTFEEYRRLTGNDAHSTLKEK
ncbi:MAG: right-handed parallel beta-helix repeat-containing protein [Planctomycetia bacterium]|nr:right-handed parallel beta-helix repeat-containing protein [Planctomycetia bacterium]